MKLLVLAELFPLLIPVHAAALFEDTFARTDSRNIQASLDGITDNTGSALVAGAVYSQPQLDPNNAAPTFGVQDDSGVFQFAHRRLIGFQDFKYEVSDDLSSWRDATVVEDSATPLPASPGYEVVTLSLAPEELTEEPRLFLQISAVP